MSKQILLISIVLLATLFSCTKEEIKDDPNNEFDLKASKMEQIGSLFDAIARQPEIANELIKSTESLYTDYTALLPLSDKAILQRGKARGAALSELFYSISRQPEAYNDLEAAADKFLGKYDPKYISDELLEITKTYSIEALNMSIVQQPECINYLNTVSVKYLNYKITK